MNREFQRIAIVNRGEPAMRLIHAVQELNREGGPPLETIALFTTPDCHAMFVRQADQAFSLGEATFVDPSDGQRKSRYLDYATLERALVETRAGAAWVGWGFVSEQAPFAELCRNLGVVFIGPDANQMRLLGDKIASKRLAESIGVAVAPWSGGPVKTAEEARRHAERLGYPLMIKATAGGGGRGMRRVESAADLGEAFVRAGAEALHTCGDATLFLERIISPARHVEVQVIADHTGTTWAVGVRDCSIQRRHQKVVEEAPSPALSPEQDRELRSAAVRLCRSAGYENAGTVEFLFEPDSGCLYFMEVNTRLQVEHPVTEMTTGLDLVKLQIHIARGGTLEGQPPSTTGHAIEVRLNAEDAERGFAPAPGAVEVLRLPTGPGLRIDIGVGEGDVVPAEFDSMIAKIVACGHDRVEALARLQRALAETIVVMREGTTNKGFLLALLDHQEMRNGTANSAWLDRLAESGEHVCRRLGEIAILQAGIDVYDAEHAIERRLFYTWAARGRPRVRGEPGHIAELRYRGNPYKLAVACLGRGHYRVRLGGQTADVAVEHLGRFERSLTWGGRRFRVVSVVQGLQYLIEVESIPHRISRDDGGLVRAPSPAVVLSIPVSPGDEVEHGARLVVLEAMKMELPVLAPFAGRVREVRVTTNVQVDTGTPLVLLDPTEPAADDSDAGERIVLTPPLKSAPEGMSIALRSREVLAGLRQFVLGFDVESKEAKEFLAEYRELTRLLPPEDADLRRAEEEILEAFADVASIFRRQPASDDPEGMEATHSEEYLFTFARSLDASGEGLPQSFLDKLRRTLSHYDVLSLDPSPELEESLLRIFKAHERADEHAPVVLAVLNRHLSQVEILLPHAGPAFRDLVDRLVWAGHGRHQAICDSAREVRYRYFEQILFERAQDRVYAEVEEHLAHLTRSPQSSDRGARIEALVSCPQPLVALLGRRFVDPDPTVRELVLEVLTRRYYRIRPLEGLEYRSLGGRSCATSRYEHEGKRVHVLATHALWKELGSAFAALQAPVAALPPKDDVVIDVYVWCAGPRIGAESAQQEIQKILDSVDFGRRTRRIVVVAAGADGGHAIAGTQYFTYRPLDGGGYAEERLYRGLHPMMGKRMHLWRFANFEIERLPSVEDVYLFHGVARENAKDERLFAIAEVRDLTPVRDSRGRVVSLPYLERMLMEALAGIRQFQAKRAPNEQLAWNRVLLFVRPPLFLDQDELNGVIRRLAPVTEGLGIEQVVVACRMPDPSTSVLQDTVIRISNPGGAGLRVTSGPPPQNPLRPLSAYDQKVLRMRQRGLTYPYEIIAMLTPAGGDLRAGFPPGEFVEHDIDAESNFVPVSREPGQNAANIVAGVIRNFTQKFPEGMARVILLGDPSKAMGALAEPECRRINAAIDLAEKMGVPVEWFALSAGAKISMESGTENMDWIAAVLRRIIEFTQAGGEINVVVNGINVGAQPYWNAEATMLLHTRGILIMTPLGAMVLTGKQALDYSGSVSAEDNQGIGGYERIMGPNGQAQYWARDVGDAARLLLQHYDLTYVLPGERFPRAAMTTDPRQRDVRPFPHAVDGGAGFGCVGDIFSREHNPERKRPFAIRRVLQAVIDQDHPPLERWSAMRDAEIAVIWDAHLGGHPVCLIGIESQPLPRLGFLPADGPDHWTAGTLFPRSSKKVARALNAASGNRPVVVLANLSGFDGSPDSMRALQLEYGAEIGRAVVNFLGPIVFCVVSRYHGGAYVVFSKRLNDNVEAAAVEGSHASVIGGAPAAAVVFAGEVQVRTRNDGRVRELEAQVAGAAGPEEKARLRVLLEEVAKHVHAEKLGEVADEFDSVHTVQRALQVGSLDVILPAERLRPYLIEAVERGMGRNGAATAARS